MRPTTRNTLIFLFLLLASFCNAQQYQCLQSGVRHYFTNSNGYLRGIRIDSIRTSGDTTIYYPFHTPRGNYTGLGRIIQLDSAGASWLGKRVWQFRDGTFQFDNLWGDTITIKTQANVGDTWIFCRDSTGLYYQAAVTRLDTMTVLGTLDSVKTIRVTAYNSFPFPITEPANGFEIMLGKNSGFVQVFDLYTFPYHAPGSSYAHGFDYFCDVIISHPAPPIPVSSPSSTDHADIYNSIFRLTSFTPPTMEQLYQWNTGDVYEYSSCVFSGNPNGCFSNPASAYHMDTVRLVNTTSTNVQYYLSGWVAYINSTFLPLRYTKEADSATSAYNTSLIIDTVLMPEELHQTMLYYYLPQDTSYCTNNPLYAMVLSDIGGASYYNPGERTGPVLIFKLPFGLVHSFTCDKGGPKFATGSENKLIYYNRSGITCQTYVLPLFTGVDSVQAIDHTITVLPNPVSNELTISSSTNIRTIAITNLLGQVVYIHNGNGSQIQVDVSPLPAGMYLVKVNGSEVQKFVKE